jgi:hypothetical protein
LLKRILEKGLQKSETAILLFSSSSVVRSASKRKFAAFGGIGDCISKDEYGLCCSTFVAPCTPAKPSLAGKNE